MTMINLNTTNTTQNAISSIKIYQQQEGNDELDNLTSAITALSDSANSKTDVIRH